MSLAAEIRAEMGRKGLRPADVYRAVGMSKQKFSKVITNETQEISFKDLGELSKFLKVPVSELVRRAEENEEGATSSTSDAPGNNKKAGHFND